MTDTPITPTDYLESRFREYFRDARAIGVTFLADETITVDVYMPDHHIIFDCEIGSDDDWYIFRDAEGGRLITLPLMADALEL